MKLALIYPPFFAHVFNENLPTVDDEFGLFPHIGFGYVKRGATAAGWETRLWDAPATKKSFEEIRDEVLAWSPDLVGFSAHACQTIWDMLPWAKRFKEETGLPMIVGGYEAKAYPHELMSHGWFDYLVAGEAHLVLPELLPALEQGGSLDKVPDLFYRSNGELKPTFRGPRPEFSEFPTPDRTVFDNSLYYSHISQRKSFTIGMSEVGCPYPCTFCCMRHSGYQARSAEQILDEMEECIALGIHEIDWFDPLMLHDRERAIDIAREVKRRDLDIIWSCRSRVDSLQFHHSKKEPDHELIEALAEGGCRRIYFGVESGDEAVLKTMKKGQTTLGPMAKTLGAVQEAGIMGLGFFIVGAPGDTPESVERTIELSTKLPLYYAQYQIAIIKPHSELERKHLLEEVGIDYWREYVLGRVGDHLLPTPWTEMERPELERLARLGYFRFYARPDYILRMLRRIESPEELVRYLRVGLQLLLRPLRPSDEPAQAKKLLRSALTFLEAALTVMNPGARHLVFKEGGGLQGALGLAARELSEQTPERRAHDVESLRKVLLEELDGEPTPITRAPDRYEPWFDTKEAKALLSIGRRTA